MQEAVCKDVERVFGVLQACFLIVRRPGHFWRENNLHDIMKACVILHNMIIEDE
jgi:Plant transposon protein